MLPCVSALSSAGKVSCRDSVKRSEIALLQTADCVAQRDSVSNDSSIAPCESPKRARRSSQYRIIPYLVPSVLKLKSDLSIKSTLHSTVS